MLPLLVAPFPICLVFRFVSFRFLVFRFVVAAADINKCVVAVCAINLAYKNPGESFR